MSQTRTNEGGRSALGIRLASSPAGKYGYVGALIASAQQHNCTWSPTVRAVCEQPRTCVGGHFLLAAEGNNRLYTDLLLANKNPVIVLLTERACRRTRMGDGGDSGASGTHTRIAASICEAVPHPHLPPPVLLAAANAATGIPCLQNRD